MNLKKYNLLHTTLFKLFIKNNALLSNLYTISVKLSENLNYNSDNKTVYIKILWFTFNESHTNYHVIVYDNAIKNRINAQRIYNHNWAFQRL